MKIFESFNEFINEKAKIRGGHQALLPIYEHYIDWLMKIYNIEKSKISISFKKLSKGSAGYLDVMSYKKGKPVLYIDKEAMPTSAMRYLAHELTHLKQMEEGKLDFSDHRYGDVFWNGKPYMKIRDYQNFEQKDYLEYKQLPWESEAYNNEATMQKIYIQSKEYKEFKDSATDNTLIYLLDNLF